EAEEPDMFVLELSVVLLVWPETEPVSCELLVPMVPFELVEPCAVTEPWFGLLLAVPAVACPPSIEPCCVVPVLPAVLVSLLELAHAPNISAAAASAVPT